MAESARIDVLLDRARRGLDRVEPADLEKEMAAGESLIDIGGGASPLVDGLIDADWSDLTVLDVSTIALETAQARLGEAADRVQWITTDLLSWRPTAPLRRLA